MALIFIGEEIVGRAGSGIARAMNENLKVEFTNNEKLSEFLITIRREENNQVEEKAGQGVNLDTNYGDLDTKHSHSEGYLGTKPRHYKDDLDTKHGHSEDDPDTKIHHLDTKKIQERVLLRSVGLGFKRDA